MRPSRHNLEGYADGDRDAVYAARPNEPTEAAWDAARRQIHDRLNRAVAPAHGRWRAAVWAVAGAALTAAAAVVVWMSSAPTKQPEVAETQPTPDALAEFAVLPMASTDEVEFQRVPGSGWFPVGAHPLPGEIALAMTDEVALDVPNPAWPQVTLSPGDAPMIFATKPR